MSTDESNDKEQQEKLVEIIRQTIERDDALREKYDVKNKFRFVHERLQTLLSHLEKDLQVTIEEIEKHADIVVGEDEQVVYVYLFNAHGLTLQTWKNMLTPKVFYEYSINRPIYEHKENVESVIKAKTNSVQHGYLSVAVKKTDVNQNSTQQDAYGNKVLKIREGSLRFDRLVAFVHNGIAYSIGDKGDLFKKE